jgi:transketolase
VKNAIVKTCSHHGALTQFQCIKSGTFRSGQQAWKCKACHKMHRVNNYTKNREKILAKTKAYKEANPEKYKALQRAYRQRLQKEADVPSSFLENTDTNKAYRSARNKLVNVMCQLSLITRAIEKGERRK